MRVTKSSGDENVIIKPKTIASPNSIAHIPKYMGGRLIRKGSVISRDEGASWGFTVASLFLNNLSAQMFNMPQMIMKIVPK